MLKTCIEGRTEDLGEPDLARGPYFAHPCRMVKLEFRMEKWTFVLRRLSKVEFDRNTKIDTRERDRQTDRQTDRQSGQF